MVAQLSSAPLSSLRSRSRGLESWSGRRGGAQGFAELIHLHETHAPRRSIASRSGQSPLETSIVSPFSVLAIEV